MPSVGASAAGAVALDHVEVAAPGGCERQARRFLGDVLGLVELRKPAPLH